MELGRYLVDAVVLEGRSYRDVAAAHGVSKSWGRDARGSLVALRVPIHSPAAVLQERGSTRTDGRTDEIRGEAPGGEGSATPCAQPLERPKTVFRSND